ncbi:MAG TPA: carbamoyltransferase C-terminal domain-containing protein [Bryobacteraceae bacterium]|nr:carbamoyltransferase C-terminal domain-containing protein [Bryobacteraceae bacterium]
MIILGVGGILSETACAVLKDGKLVAAVEERKLTRVRHTSGLPEHSVAYCLKQVKASPAEVDYLAVVRPLSTGREADLHLEMRQRFPNCQVVLLDHHLAHAASAYYVSPFEDATVLTLDRTGDSRCGARWRASGSTLQHERELYFPDSLGHLYGRVTALLGFEAASDEHKVQWLSASGDDRYTAFFLDILSAGKSDWPRVDRSYFDGDRLGHGAFSAKFYHHLGLDDGQVIPADLRAHVAAGVQRAMEQTVVRMAGSGERLCLGGGLALNAMIVEALERSGQWSEVYVQPAAGNAGTAIGAAAYAWHGPCGATARVSMDSLFLGPSFEAEEIKQVLENCKLRFHYQLTGDELIDAAVHELEEHKIVAWMQGRMEFGPRALGNRSLLASPLDPYSTENLNLFIKHREPFRKFAASVPAELVGEYFDVGPNAQFLATVGRVKEKHRKTFQSAILGHDIVRVHTVSEKDNPRYWRLLHAAGKSAGLPVLYNTSFNLFGDPLVCSPRDAVRSFYSSGIDSLFAGHFLLQK